MFWFYVLCVSEIQKYTKTCLPIRCKNLRKKLFWELWVSLTMKKSTFAAACNYEAEGERMRMCFHPSDMKENSVFCEYVYVCVVLCMGRINVLNLTLLLKYILNARYNCNTSFILIHVLNGEPRDYINFHFGIPFPPSHNSVICILTSLFYCLPALS